MRSKSTSHSLQTRKVSGFHTLGYKLTSSHQRNTSERKDSRKDSHKENQGTVNIWVTEHPPVKYLLKSFDDPAMANFISWNRAYCLFPRSLITPPALFALYPSKFPGRFESICSYKAAFENYNGIKSPPYKPGELRCVADKHTWMIDLEIPHNTSPKFPEFVTEMCFPSLLEPS